MGVNEVIEKLSNTDIDNKYFAFKRFYINIPIKLYDSIEYIIFEKFNNILMRVMCLHKIA